MVNQDEAQKIAEQFVQDYVTKCGCTENIGFQNIMEMLVSSCVRSVEKYNGQPAAIRVLNITTKSLLENPQQQSDKVKIIESAKH